MVMEQVQTFDNIYLGMYNEEDLTEYWDKFFNSKVPITEEGKQKIYDFTGHHPYLLDLFNFNLFNNSLLFIAITFPYINFPHYT